MELDEMKVAWQELNARVERTHALNRQLLKDYKTGQATRDLRPLVVGQWLQLSIGAIVACTGAAYWATHLQPLYLLACGIIVQAYGILLIVLAANNLYLIHHIDNSAPVLAIQRRVAELRAFRVRVESPIIGVACCFIWIPVTYMALAGMDVQPWPGFLAWALTSSVVALALIVVTVLVMRRMGRTRALEDNSAGRSIVRAQAALDEIARFEHE